VRQPIADMASTAAELLLRRLRDRQAKPTTVRIEAELVMRDSIATRGRRAAIRK
jgi:DNA-binding LacI/PurR family transcriptional regulator